MRTKISEFNVLIVHFFVTRQKNEPKKVRVGVAPLRTLLSSRATPNSAKPNSKVCLDGSTPSPRARRGGKHAIAFLLNRTRLSQSADFAFAASKRTAKTEGFSTGRKDELGKTAKTGDFYGKKCCRDVLRSFPCVILSGARRSARSRTDLATIFL